MVCSLNQSFVDVTDVEDAETKPPAVWNPTVVEVENA
jgi:hypothetical protein